MKLPWSEDARWYGLVAGLVATLGLLVALQYRSVKAVSATMTEQMRANLRGSLMDVRQALERELRPLCQELLLRDGPSLQSDLRELAMHFESWRGAATHPNLVKDVYVWAPNRKGPTDLLKLTSSGTTFDLASSPEDVTRLKTRLAQIIHSGKFEEGGLRRAIPLSEPDGTHPRLIMHDQHPWMIDQDIPALVHLTYLRTGGGAEEPSLNNWIIIVLDRKVLEQHILSELVQHYFGTNDQSPYQVAVIDSNQRAPDLFASDAKLNGSPRIVDAGLNLFGRPTLWVASGEDSSAGMFFPLAARSTHGPRSSSGPPKSGDENHDEVPPSLRVYPLHYPDGQEWEIVARHRLGSVDSAVSALSRRNLTFNLGVVAVLASTVALIIAAGLRARRFGQLQMEFVANVSHELRTPLTGIVSAAQNIADGLIDDKQKVATYGKAIIQEAQQLSELVEQILQFSAIQSNGDRYHFQPVDVAETVNLALRNTSAFIQSANVRVEQQIESGLPLISADGKALARCLQNLIGNAVKYGGEQRWIGIHAGVANSSNGHQEVFISVADKGIGIRPEDLDHIFEPFYRAPEVSEAQIHGTGLGLPLAKKIAEAMGGTITAASESGQGSTFTLHLPLK